MRWAKASPRRRGSCATRSCGRRADGAARCAGSPSAARRRRGEVRRRRDALVAKVGRRGRRGGGARAMRDAVTAAPSRLREAVAAAHKRLMRRDRAVRASCAAPPPASGTRRRVRRSASKGNCARAPQPGKRVHPDKTRDDRANRAFDQLRDAYELLAPWAARQKSPRPPATKPCRNTRTGSAAPGAARLCAAWPAVAPKPAERHASRADLAAQADERGTPCDRQLQREDERRRRSAAARRRRAPRRARPATRGADGLPGFERTLLNHMPVGLETPLPRVLLNFQPRRRVLLRLLAAPFPSRWPAAARSSSASRASTAPVRRRHRGGGLRTRGHLGRLPPAAPSASAAGAASSAAPHAWRRPRRPACRSGGAAGCTAAAGCRRRRRRPPPPPPPPPARGQCRAARHGGRVGAGRRARRNPRRTRRRALPPPAPSTSRGAGTRRRGGPAARAAGRAGGGRGEGRAPGVRAACRTLLITRDGGGGDLGVVLGGERGGEAVEHLNVLLQQRGEAAEGAQREQPRGGLGAPSTAPMRRSTAHG